MFRYLGIAGKKLVTEPGVLDNVEEFLRDMARLMRESSGGGGAMAAEPPGSPLTESDDDSSEFGTPTGAG